MQARRIGILGGTFDPIHNGHIDMTVAAQAALGLAKIFVIPANVPPHRPQPGASTFHRFAMVAMTVHGRERWHASDLELRIGGPSYTTDTLARFRQRGYAPDELFFIVGADAFADIASWRNYPKILDQAHFVVVSRPGFPAPGLKTVLPALAPRMTMPPLDALSQLDPVILLIDAPTADVSSTAIRRRRGEGLTLSGLVPEAVQQHIEQHGLYTSMSPGRRASDAPPAPAAGRLHGEH